MMRAETKWFWECSALGATVSPLGASTDKPLVMPEVV